MAGIFLDIYSEFQWVGGLQVGGYPGAVIGSVSVAMDKWKYVDRGYDTSRRIDTSEDKYKIINTGARTFDVVRITDTDVILSKYGTYNIDVIKYTQVQKYIVAPDQVLGM